MLKCNFFSWKILKWDIFGIFKHCACEKSKIWVRVQDRDSQECSPKFQLKIYESFPCLKAHCTNVRRLDREEVCIAKSLLTKHLKTSRSLLKKEARRDGTTLPLFSSSFFSRNEWVETIWHYGFNYAVTFSNLSLVIHTGPKSYICHTLF